MHAIGKNLVGQSSTPNLTRQLLAFIEALSLLLITTGSAVVNVPETIQSADNSNANKIGASNPIDDWANVLKKHVNSNGQVDFKGVQNNTQRLHRYVRYVAETDPQQAFSKPDQRLAHRINAYNAIAKFAVLENGIHHTNAGLIKVKFLFF